MNSHIHTVTPSDQGTIGGESKVHQDEDQKLVFEFTSRKN